MPREAKLWRPRAIPRFAQRAGAIFWCIAGLLVTGTAGPHCASNVACAAFPEPAAPAQQDGGEPFSLTLVPEKVNVLLAIRPAALLKHEALRSSAALLNKELNLQATLGMRVEQVEQFLFVIYEGNRTRFVVKAQKPVDQRRFRSIDVPNPVIEDMAGKLIYAAVGAKSSDLAYCFTDERTVVFDSRDGLQKWLASPAPAAPAWAEQWKAVASEDAALLIDVKSLRAVLTDAVNRGRTPGAGGFTEFVAQFAALWEQTDLAVAGGTVRHGVTFHATAHCISADGAQRVQTVLELLLTQFRGGIADLRREAARAGGDAKETATWMALVDAIEKLLKEVKVAQEGSKVELTTQAPASILAVASALAPAGVAAREAAQRAHASNNMKQLMLAMHNYHDSHNKFPAAAPLGKDGKTPHSWRIDILPYLDQQALYDQYKFDEPWDSEANRKVLAQMPAVFRAPQDDPKSTNSAYFGLTGPDAIMSETNGTSIAKIIDGTANTIMLVEAKRDVPWTKPEDIPFDAEKDLPKLGGWNKDGFIAAFADGSVRFVSQAVDADLLKKLFTKAGREPVQLPR